LSVHKRTFICTTATKFNTEITHCSVHLIRMNDPSRPFAFPFFSCRLRSTHHSSCTMNSAVKCISTFFRIHALSYDRYIAHASTHNAFLTSSCRSSSFSHYLLFIPVMYFFPGIVMMIVNFRNNFSTQNIQDLLDNDISSSICILSSKLHSPEIHIPQFFFHV